MPTQRLNYLAYSLLKQGCTAKDFCGLSDLSRHLSQLNAYACPRQESNLRTSLRRAVLYPLSYGGACARLSARA